MKNTFKIIYSPIFSNISDIFETYCSLLLRSYKIGSRSEINYSDLNSIDSTIFFSILKETNFTTSFSYENKNLENEIAQIHFAFDSLSFLQESSRIQKRSFYKYPYSITFFLGKIKKKNQESCNLNTRIFSLPNGFSLFSSEKQISRNFSSLQFPNSLYKNSFQNFPIQLSNNFLKKKNLIFQKNKNRIVNLDSLNFLIEKNSNSGIIFLSKQIFFKKKNKNDFFKINEITCSTFQLFNFLYDSVLLRNNFNTFSSNLKIKKKEFNSAFLPNPRCSSFLYQTRAPLTSKDVFHFETQTQIYIEIFEKKFQSFLESNFDNNIIYSLNTPLLSKQIFSSQVPNYLKINQLKKDKKKIINNLISVDSYFLKKCLLLPYFQKKNKKNISKINFYNLKRITSSFYFSSIYFSEIKKNINNIKFQSNQNNIKKKNSIITLKKKYIFSSFSLKKKKAEDLFFKNCFLPIKKNIYREFFSPFFHNEILSFKNQHTTTIADVEKISFSFYSNFQNFYKYSLIAKSLNFFFIFDEKKDFNLTTQKKKNEKNKFRNETTKGLKKKLYLKTFLIKTNIHSKFSYFGIISLKKKIKKLNYSNKFSQIFFFKNRLVLKKKNLFKNKVFFYVPKKMSLKNFYQNSLQNSLQTIVQIRKFQQIQKEAQLYLRGATNYGTLFL